MYNFIDLFAGIGGFRVSMERLGMKCVFSSEIDEHARMVYQRNFNDNPRGDICEINAREIPKHDILCAGFPCQSFSIAGKKGGMDDRRGRLFYEILRVVEYHKPLVLLLENVRNILTVDGGDVMKTIEARLDEAGYSVHYSLLDASDYGIPQKRERVYFACVRKGTGLRYKEPKPDRKDIFLKDVLDDFVDERLIIRRDDITIEKDGEPEPAHKPIRIGHLNKGGQGERIYHPNGHAITLAADSGGVGSRTGLYLVDGVVRRLSISECKRLMGFDVNHVTDVGARGYRQLGNAVIPDMVTRAYDSIVI
ncbi:MAG: DNA cytosine methyltransferase [Candidatus Dadabacteria bacterium]|nr:DNA cytosine methyltransferase [Candidatus Dadabacteria bacterium]MYE60950.1 DNA cytosine methyltransferase [Candidatus Dadabacteria bacterium]